MTAQKHTAGPWEVDGTGGIIRTKTGVNERGGMTGGVCVAQFWTRPSKADARLIAASPDMLEAFERILASDGMRPGHVEYLSRAEIAAIARDAKAKATGQ